MENNFKLKDFSFLKVQEDKRYSLVKPFVSTKTNMIKQENSLQNQIENGKIGYITYKNPKTRETILITPSAMLYWGKTNTKKINPTLMHYVTQTQAAFHDAMREVYGENYVMFLEKSKQNQEQ